MSAGSTCVDGVLLSDIVVTAVHDFPGGWIWISYGVYLGQKFGYTSNQELPALAAGESTTVTHQILPGPVRVEVRLKSYGRNIVTALFEAPTCTLPPTAPTVSVTVQRCAGDDSGGAIAVTVTNPPGGRESLGDLIVGEAAGWPPEGDVEFWSYYRRLSISDGEQKTMVVDELTLRSPDASRAGQVKPIAAGDYVVVLGWSVDDIGNTRRDPVLVTVPGCAARTPTSDDLPPTGLRTNLLPIAAGSIALIGFGLALLALRRHAGGG